MDDAVALAPVARPAVELATANDVPVSTVHAWIKEARRRGLEPYGQRIPEEIRKMSDEEIMRRLAELRPEKYAAAYEEMHEEEER